MLSSEEIERWARSVDWPLMGLDQDQDALLAERKHLETIVRLLGGQDAQPEKKRVIVSALLLLLGDHLEGNEELETEDIERISAAVRHHADVCRSAYPEIALDSEILLRRLLGDPIPRDTPDWIRRLAERLR